MRVFLDDVRDPPLFDRLTGERLVWDAVCRTADELIALVNTGNVRFISFDHDLGHDKSGYDAACYIEKLAAKDKIPRIDYTIHSGNVVGAGNIDRAMKSAHRFWDSNA